MSKNKFVKRKGLDGPFSYPNGRVLYFDPASKQYWDPRTDFFVEQDELEQLRRSIFDVVRG